jgi:hypothetical protein
MPLGHGRGRRNKNSTKSAGNAAIPTDPGERRSTARTERRKTPPTSPSTPSPTRWRRSRGYFIPCDDAAPPDPSSPEKLALNLSTNRHQGTGVPHPSRHRSGRRRRGEPTAWAPAVESGEKLVASLLPCYERKGKGASLSRTNM